MTEQAADDAIEEIAERMHYSALELADRRLSLMRVADTDTLRRLRRAFYAEAALELLAYNTAKTVTETGDSERYSQVAVWILVDHIERLAQFGEPG